MSYWPFWGVGLALAAVPVLHWLATGRMFAISSRVTALNDRLRARLAGRADEGDEAMTPEEMAEALREATAAAFGAGSEAPVAEAAGPLPLPPISTGGHLGFLVAIMAGAALSAALAGGLSVDVSAAAMGPAFERTFGGGLATTLAVLFGGGLLVGFGTRMAGGCTSGHGLCGVSRFQRGSLVATAAFFGAGVLVSLLLGR